MGSDSSKYLNEVTVNSFEAMQLSPNLRTELKVKILAYIQEGNASIKVSKKDKYLQALYIDHPCSIASSCTPHSPNSSSIAIKVRTTWN